MFDHPEQLSRRRFIHLLGAASLAGMLPGCTSSTNRRQLPAKPNLTMMRFPEKTDLILITDRAPQLETPLHYFRQDVTPSEAFFVRWHLEGIPTEIDESTFRLKVRGNVDQPLSLSLAELKQDFDPVSLYAVCQCSGNSRSFFAPRVPGGQWQNGAMGMALWTGVRLKDVLAKARVKAGSVEVSLDGLDASPLPTVADFVKSLKIEHALDNDVLIAYEMNGRPLPMLNGFPLRLVVPGWYATYWVKMLHDINVLDKPFDGFWMKKAYLIPDNKSAEEQPDALAKKSVPINKFTVRSLFVLPEPGDTIAAQKPFEIQGLAFDSGSGIKSVEVSTDNGATWHSANLDKPLGKYAWIRWKHVWTPVNRGRSVIWAKATSNDGTIQPDVAGWNKSGYMRNVIERIDVDVV